MAHWPAGRLLQQSCKPSCKLTGAIAPRHPKGSSAATDSLERHRKKPQACCFIGKRSLRYKVHRHICTTYACISKPADAQALSLREIKVMSVMIILIYHFEIIDFRRFSLSQVAPSVRCVNIQQSPIMTLVLVDGYQCAIWYTKVYILQSTYTSLRLWLRLIQPQTKVGTKDAFPCEHDEIKLQYKYIYLVFDIRQSSSQVWRGYKNQRYSTNSGQVSGGCWKISILKCQPSYTGF